MGGAHTLEKKGRTPGTDVTPATAPDTPQPVEAVTAGTFAETAAVASKAAPAPAASVAPPSPEPMRIIASEQLLYAKILATGMYTGLGVLLLTFALYITGAVEPAIPIDRLPDFWKLDVTEYLAAVNVQYLHHEHAVTGWAWLGVLNRGDYLNFVGIALLASVTLVCFLGIIPTLLRKRDYAYTAIAVAETLILTLAASGMLTAGGH